MDDKLEGLFEKHSAMVFRLCLRYVTSREEAEDLTQEVFLKVGRSLNGFQGASSIGTWIYRIAANSSLDYLRKLNRRTDLHAKHPMDAADRSFHSGGARELARIDLKRLLSRVKPEIREFLFLTHLEGMNYQEAAKKMGKSIEVIAKAVQRFKKSEPVKIRALELQRIDQFFREDRPIP
jgi:RNA polymerase sigma-70 factor (ECF subfamily)